MQITDIPIEGHERVVRANDEESGLDAYIAVHDTTFGPGLGGLRMWPYETADAALTDVLRLSEGMTYKSALAKTGVGGGKAVIIGDPAKIKSEALYLAMGRFIDSLGGLYITAEDVNTAVADLEIVRRRDEVGHRVVARDGRQRQPLAVHRAGRVLGHRGGGALEARCRQPRGPARRRPGCWGRGLRARASPGGRRGRGHDRRQAR